MVTRIAGLLLPALLAACAAAPGPDTILVNGKVFSANPAQPWAEAIAITRERVTGVGDTASIAALARDTTRRIDLGGRTVIPGQIEPALRLSGVTEDTVRTLAGDAYAGGVTSVAGAADGAIKDAVAAFVAADPALRVMLFRRPRPTAAGHSDSRPFFPPQPTPRINVKGMSFDMSAADLDRLALVAGWAYGSEDPLSVHPVTPDVIEAYVNAIARAGSAEVWRAKRPRLEGPVMIPSHLHSRLKEFGIVVVQRPGDGISLKSLVTAGVRVAFAPGVAARFASVKHALAEASEPERLSVPEVIRLITTEAAFADFADSDQGQISVGMFADLAVLSADVFSVPVADIEGVHSVMTMSGGRIVHDRGAIR